MIEIIQEENRDTTQERKGLPKNIKQIGTPDVGDRIYIENSAYQKMHPYGQHADKMVYVMLGSFDDFAGHACIFVEDVIEMNEIEFRGNLPIWNDDSWGHLYRKLRPDHEDMIIVGWAVDICGQLPSMTAQLERVHQTYFGGVHQILLLLDTLEREEAFFSNRNGYLKRREGFYIYYDKAIPGRMESVAEEREGILSHEDEGKDRDGIRDRNEGWGREEEREFRRRENYRNYLNNRRVQRKVPQPVYKSSHMSTVLLLAVILALGYSAFQNHQKMKNMELALAQMNELQTVMQAEQGDETVINVEDVAGIITSTQEQSTQEPVSTQAQSTQEPSSAQEQGTQEQASVQTQSTQTPSSQVNEGAQDVNSAQSAGDTQSESSTQTISESDAYLEQGYYIVQNGENLAGICRKIYHSTAMLDEVCEVNGIENPDAIYAGQYLKLP